MLAAAVREHPRSERITVATYNIALTSPEVSRVYTYDCREKENRQVLIAVSHALVPLFPFDDVVTVHAKLTEVLEKLGLEITTTENPAPAALQQAALLVRGGAGETEPEVELRSRGPVFHFDHSNIDSLPLTAGFAPISAGCDGPMCA